MLLDEQPIPMASGAASSHRNAAQSTMTFFIDVERQRFSSMISKMNIRPEQVQNMRERRHIVESQEAWQMNGSHSQAVRLGSSWEHSRARKRRISLSGLPRKHSLLMPCDIIRRLKEAFKSPQKARSINGKPMRYENGGIASCPQASSLWSSARSYRPQTGESMASPTTSAHAMDARESNPDRNSRTPSIDRTSPSGRVLRLHEHDGGCNLEPLYTSTKRQSARFSHPAVTDIMPVPPTPTTTVGTRKSIDALSIRPGTPLSVESTSPQHSPSTNNFAEKVDPEQLVKQAGGLTFRIDETAIFAGVLRKAAMQRMDGMLSAINLKHVVQQHIDEMNRKQDDETTEERYALAIASGSDMRLKPQANEVPASHQGSECFSTGEYRGQNDDDEIKNSYRENQHSYTLELLGNSPSPDLQTDRGHPQSLTGGPSRRNLARPRRWSMPEMLHDRLSSASISPPQVYLPYLGGAFVPFKPMAIFGTVDSLSNYASTQPAAKIGDISAPTCADHEAGTQNESRYRTARSGDYTVHISSSHSPDGSANQETPVRSSVFSVVISKIADALGAKNYFGQSAPHSNGALVLYPETTCPPENRKHKITRNPLGSTSRVNRQALKHFLSASINAVGALITPPRHGGTLQPLSDAAGNSHSLSGPNKPLPALPYTCESVRTSQKSIPEPFRMNENSDLVIEHPQDSHELQYLGQPSRVLSFHSSLATNTNAQRSQQAQDEHKIDKRKIKRCDGKESDEEKSRRLYVKRSTKQTVNTLDRVLHKICFRGL